MERHKLTFSLIFYFILIYSNISQGQSEKPVVSGELKKWHTVTLTFIGLDTNENAEPNPFRDYRLNVTFSRGQKQYEVAGYYAADGNAAETSAKVGNKWRVHFLPDEEGQWSYTASFQTGPDIALTSDPKAGSAIAFDGASGTFTITPSDKAAPDFRAKGLLKYIGKRYLQFAETGQYFLKGGADSPENFLGYADFDDTFDSGELKREGEAAGEIFIHHYQPHVKDWRPGDPTWENGKGKGIIGALNYLASKGMNSVYFLTYNIDGGDGKDVWPWTNPGEKFRFDCSKLDQWEIVFSHMDRLGIMLFVITQETENDQGLDGGELGPQRKLYYRELIARFAHHPALVWNLGEENTNTDDQRKAFCQYIKELDPYDHPIVCHTYPGRYDEVYRPLLGYQFFDGLSLQTTDTHAQTLKWIKESASAGRPWFVCEDEIGPADTGVMPDANDYWHNDVRRRHLWGNLMAGGAGIEYYFGYKFPNNDLNCEDWRSRDHLWDLTRYALEFFHQYLPFTEMEGHDELIPVGDGYCFARPGQIYAIYLPIGGTTNLDLGNNAGPFTIQWYNPRTGGLMQAGSVSEITGPGLVSIGSPPVETASSADADWVALINLK
jgi:hypothetical protein